MSYLNPWKLKQNVPGWGETVSWQSVCHVFVHVRQGGVERRGKEKGSGLPGKVSEWGHGPHAPNSYLPACASGNADFLPPLVGQSHWLHQARPGWGLSRSGVQEPEGPPQSLPPCQSPGQARGLAWSSGWAAVSFGAGRDWVMTVPKTVLLKSFPTAWRLNKPFTSTLTCSVKLKPTFPLRVGEMRSSRKQRF